MSIQFKDYSMRSDKKYDQGWYDWCVFVDGEKSAVSRIKAVEYKLHPTFSNPTRLITDKKHRFALISSGWGGFLIKIRVIFEDGSEESTSHVLRLHEKGWPTKSAPASFDSQEAGSVYRMLTEGKYRWRKVRTVAAKVGLPEIRVEELLREMEEQELVRELPYKSIDGQSLWASTAIVGLWPLL